MWRHAASERRRCSPAGFPACVGYLCSAGQAGEPGRRVPCAVRAAGGELPRVDAEDAGQSPYLVGREAALPAVAAAFGRAYRGIAYPPHSLADVTLGPSPALSEGTDVCADDSCLLPRDDLCCAPPFRHHARSRQVTT